MLVAGLALGAFAISLLATLPVQVAARYAVPPVKINGFSGTVWNGSATLDGGHTLTWHVDPWWSLTALGPELDIGVVGPGTDLSGHIGLRGLSAGDVRLDALNGRLAWPLVAALVPDLPIACDTAATLENVALRIAPGRRSGSGALRGGPGTCARTDGAEDPVVVPDLLGSLETRDDGLRLVVTGLDAPDTPLAEIDVSNDDRLIVTVFPEGAALVPGMPTSGDTTLEYPLPELSR